MYIYQESSWTTIFNITFFQKLMETIWFNQIVIDINTWRYPPSSVNQLSIHFSLQKREKHMQKYIYQKIYISK